MSKRSRRRHQSEQQPILRRLLYSYWTWLIVGVFLIAGGLLAGAYLPLKNPGVIPLPQVEARGDAAPDFELVSLDNETLSLSNYQGQVVLVNFWATWCPPCRAELPDLVSYYEEYADDGFMLLGINEQEDAVKVAAFLEEQGLDFPVLLDLNGSVMADYGVSGMPSSFLIDETGKIVSMWTGMINREVLEQSITPLLEG